MSKLQSYATDNSMTLWETLKDIVSIDSINEPTKQRILQFVSLIESYQHKAKQVVVSHLALDLIDAIGLEKWVRDDTEEGETRWQNIQELITVMHKYDALEPETSITSFLEEVSLVSEVDKLTDAHDDALTLMTLHLCKGLEFEHVLIAGCEEGIFPHSNSMFDKEQLEEECRIMYVGMTRAKSDLTLMSARSRQQWGETQANAPSRFLDEIPESLVERRSDDVLSAFAWASKSGQQKAYSGHLKPFTQEKSDLDVEFNQDVEYDTEFSQSALSEGARVHHPSFGPGTVTAVRGDVADIAFDSGEKKTLALSIAPLTVL